MVLTTLVSNNIDLPALFKGERYDGNMGGGGREVGKKGREIKEGSVLTGSPVTLHCKKKVAWRMGMLCSQTHTQIHTHSRT